MIRYFIFTTESGDENEEPDYATLTFKGSATDEPTALLMADRISGGYYNRNVHLFKGELIAEAVGGDSFGPVTKEEVQP